MLGPAPGLGSRCLPGWAVRGLKEVARARPMGHARRAGVSRRHRHRRASVPGALTDQGQTRSDVRGKRSSGTIVVKEEPEGGVSAPA